MTSTRDLLRTAGDQQLKHCPPLTFWNCRHISTDVTRLTVLKRCWPVLNRRGMPETFLVQVVWASDPAETQAWSTAYSLS